MRLSGKRRQRLLLPALVLAVSGLVLPPGSDPHLRVYTYAQLRASGIPTGPTPNEVALPTCSPDSTWGGFATAEEAEASVTDSEVDSCMVDPAQATYGLGLPAPSARTDENQTSYSTAIRNSGTTSRLAARTGAKLAGSLPSGCT